MALVPAANEAWHVHLCAAYVPTCASHQLRKPFIHSQSHNLSTLDLAPAQLQVDPSEYCSEVLHVGLMEVRGLYCPVCSVLWP